MDKITIELSLDEGPMLLRVLDYGESAHGGSTVADIEVRHVVEKIKRQMLISLFVSAGAVKQTETVTLASVKELAELSPAYKKRMAQQENGGSAQISALQEERNRVGDWPSGAEPRKRVLSAAGKARQLKGVKAYWARRRKESK